MFLVLMGTVMKGLLILAIAGSIVDCFANDARILASALGWLASTGHAIANIGATMMPSMN